MGELLKGAIHISDWESIPWHNHNVHMHSSYCPQLKQTTLTLFTKDHQKVVKLTDDEYSEFTSSDMKNNWALIQKRIWQKELRAMYQNMGD